MLSPWEVEDAVLLLVNQYRAARGLCQVAINSDLAHVARLHCQTVMAQGLCTPVSHGNLRARVQHLMIAESWRPAMIEISENLSYFATGTLHLTNLSTAQYAVDAWHSSQAHQAILVKHGWSSAGVGFAAASVASNRGAIVSLVLARS